MNARFSKRRGLNGARGFTLIEVIVVVTMLAILAAIAIPNYSEYIRRGHRAAAQEYLISLASRQVQYYLDRREFAASDVCPAPSPAPATSCLNATPPADLANRYTVAIAPAAGPPATFTITATPTGSQTGERCGNLTIDQTGARGAAATGCW